MEYSKMKKYVIIIIALIVGLAFGWLFFSGNDNAVTQDQSSETVEFWTCSMHPNVRAQEPGDCPICGMDLIPAKTGGSEVDNSSITLNENQIRIANIRTMVVGEGTASSNTRLNGKIVVDERQVFTQPSHFTGRIERLFINFTGAKVSSGQKIATIYSPELILMQKELLSAYSQKEERPELLSSIKNKLKRKKIHDEQINKIIEKGEVIDNFDIYAHQSGIVTKLFINSGGHISTGEPIIELANLNQLWVVFDAYEGNLANMRIGDVIKFKVTSYPDKEFSSTITYIDPIINSETRTAKIRGSINNSNGILKPEMLAIGNVSSSNSNNQLIIPESAVLWTGERSVVYVKTGNKDEFIFEAREVEIGQLTDSGYPIKNGLELGEEVAVNGAFSIDAAAQIAGKPNMMNMDKGDIKPMKGHDHGEMPMPEPKKKSKISNNVKEINKTLDIYMKLTDSFVKTDLAKAKINAKELSSYIKKNLLNNSSFKNSTHEKEIASIYKLANRILETSDIEKARKEFSNISVLMINLITETNVYDKDLFVLKCPMSSVGDSAVWLSDSKKILNPYFGDKMLKCGFVKNIIKK